MNRQITVVEKETYGYDASLITYACLNARPRDSRETRRRGYRNRRLVSRVSCVEFCSGGTVAAGKLVANYYSNGDSAIVTVLNVKTGQRQTTGAGNEWLYGFDVNYYGVVWAEPDNHDVAVKAFTRDGERLALDKSPEIDLHSVALVGRRVGR